jgi:hypothetical protein
MEAESFGSMVQNSAALSTQKQVRSEPRPHDAPMGYHIMARGYRSNVCVVLLTGSTRVLLTLFPRTSHRKREARNEEIRLRYADGSDAVELPTDYGVSETYLSNCARRARLASRMGAGRAKDRVSPM